MNYADLFRVTLPETALELTALLVLVVDLGFLRKAGLSARVAAATVLGLVGCCVALCLLAGQGTGLLSVPGFDGASVLLRTGGAVAVAQIAIVALTALTLLLLVDAPFTRHIGEYVAVVLMAAVGGLLIAAADDLLVIFIGLELLSLSLYIMTAFAKASGKSAEAALKYYLFGGMSAAFLLFGFSFFYGLSGSTNIERIQASIAASGPSPLLYLAWVLVVAGLGFKVAAVPFHLWAPDTYEGAPAPAAAFIASVSKVAGFALLITICVRWQAAADALPAWFRVWMPLANLLLLVAAASMLVGNLAALAQSSVRRLLAYSAVAHAGYLVLGIGIHPGNAGLADPAHVIHSAIATQNAVLYYVITYGLTTIGAFALVGVVERATGSDRLDAFLGLHKRNPLLAAVLLVLFLSLAGIPPLVGFWAKFNLFAAVLGVNSAVLPIALVALAVAMSAVSLYYYLQVLKRAYVLPAVDNTPIHVHPVTLVVLLATAVGVVVLGCFPALLQGWIQTHSLM